MTSVVLCDDHRIVREGVRRLLEDSNGFRIIGEAADGIEALRLVTELCPDVLVTDLRMPGMDGIEVTRRIRDTVPDTRVIILSMYRSEAYVYSALLAGARAYVVKESGIHDLGAAIGEVMKGGRYLSAPLTYEAVESYRVSAGKPPLPPESEP